MKRGIRRLPDSCLRDHAGSFSFITDGEKEGFRDSAFYQWHHFSTCDRFFEAARPYCVARKTSHEEYRRGHRYSLGITIRMFGC